MTRAVLGTALGILGIVVCGTAGADGPGNAFAGGKLWMDLRLRIERVDQDNPLRNATASTLRLRPGVETGTYRGFSALIELEGVAAIGSDRYNSTVNGKTAYSVVADPEDVEVNRAQLAYTGFDNTRLVYGRQRLILDNSRFVGNVGWRQNEQTYDGFTLVNTSLPDTTLTAGAIWNVNRVFSERSPTGNFKMDSAILNATYRGWKAGALTAYGYGLDFANAPGSSTLTTGLRFVGASPIGNERKFQYTVEAATQRDFRDNPARFRLGYHRLEAGVAGASYQVALGHERLGSNGTTSFQTPLATLHAMNGWADVFLTTPAGGLRDAYLSAGTTALGLKWLAQLHRFSADRGGARYGSEWDLQATRSVYKTWTVGAKLARYNAKSFAVDTDKLWLWAETTF